MAFRKPALAAGAVLVTGTLLFLWHNERGAAKQAAEQARDARPIARSQVELRHLTLGRREGGAGAYALGGEVANNSGRTLTGLTLDVRVYDCPRDVITSKCVVISENQDVSVSLDVPPHQVQPIAPTAVDLSGVPTVMGHFLWSCTLTGATGR